jgi:hypothetical protein
MVWKEAVEVWLKISLQSLSQEFRGASKNRKRQNMLMGFRVVRIECRTSNADFWAVMLRCQVEIVHT